MQHTLSLHTILVVSVFLVSLLSACGVPEPPTVAEPVAQVAPMSARDALSTVVAATAIAMHGEVQPVARPSVGISGAAAESSPREASPSAMSAPPTATANPPTATPQPATSTPEPPTATPLPPTATAIPPTPTPSGPVGSVFNGGNVRSQPNLHGRVLDQINAGEMIALDSRSVDGQWYHITNPRGVTGWVSTSLLSVDSNTAAQVSGSAYGVLDIRDLVKNPNRYQGTPIQITGKIFNIDESDGKTFFQMFVQIPGGSVFDTEAVMVYVTDTLDGAFEDTMITVYGVGAGAKSGTNAFGGEISQPAIQADYVQY